MGAVTLDAYLFFDGNCREAVEFYQGIFGGKLEVQTYDQVPGTGESMKGKIMHASLMDGDVNLMASDKSTADSLGAGKISLALSGYDEEKLTTMFNKLAEGGTVNSPLKKESWGDTFGMLTDAYGIDWMVNIGTKKD